MSMFDSSKSYSIWLFLLCLCLFSCETTSENRGYSAEIIISNVYKAIAEKLENENQVVLTLIIPETGVNNACLEADRLSKWKKNAINELLSEKTTWLLEDFKIYDRFKIIDREVLEVALKEIKLQLSDITDPAHAAEIGTIIGSNYIYALGFSRYCSDNKITDVEARKLIDISTSQIVASDTVRYSYRNTDKNLDFYKTIIKADFNGRSAVIDEHGVWYYK